MTKFKTGDRVVRIKGHPDYAAHEGEYATVVEDNTDERGISVVLIKFDRNIVFDGQMFKSYRCNLRLLEIEETYDTDE